MMRLTRILLSLMGTVAVNFFIYKTISIYLMRRRYRHIPGPPATGLFGFYMGNLKRIAQVMNTDGTVLADLMNEWVQTYGSVFKFQVADQMIVFTVNKLGVKEVLITENFPKVPGIYGNVGFPYNERFLGNGLITDTNKIRWKQRRAKFNSSFHKECLMKFEKEINTKGDVLLERFKKLADGVTLVKLFEEMNRAALDIIASAAFGIHVDSINNPENDLNKCVYESVKGFYRIQFEPLIFYQPWEWMYIHRYKKTLRKLREIGRNEILSRLELIKNDEDYMTDDMLTKLLKSHESEEFDIEDMVDDFSTFFIAGQETTANTLAFCFLELARNAEILKKLRDEIDEVLGSKNTIDFDQLNKLTYTHYVYKETLRLWPPIPEMARLIDGDFKIDGYQIPRTTWLQISTYVSARQDKYFTDSKKFIPERWTVMDNPEDYMIQNYTYFPFSLGPRSCIGQNFAKMVGKIFIAKVVKNFDITLDMDQNFGVAQVATLRPADSVRCFLTPRKK